MYFHFLTSVKKMIGTSKEKRNGARMERRRTKARKGEVMHKVRRGQGGSIWWMERRGEGRGA